VSTIPAVIAALVAVGEATFNGDEWQTIDGPANSVTTTRDRVFAVADEEIVSPTDADSYGAGSLAERYTVPLVASVSLPGPDTLATARLEAFTAYEDFCGAVLAAPGRNLGLGGQGVIDVVPTSERRIQQFANENGRSVAVRFGVDVYAHLEGE
jgi:hypothetical protein